MDIKKLSPAAKSAEVVKPLVAETKTVYKLGSLEFQNFISPQGTIVTFYQGYIEPESEEVEAFVKKLKGVEKIQVPADFVVPTAPGRSQSVNLVKRGLGNSATVGVMSHAEMLQRAIASSTETPQAQESNSQV